MTGLRVLCGAVLLGAVPACPIRERSTVANGTSAPPMSELWTEPDEGLAATDGS